eukprot:SAG31_NODE_2639_length_5327_cov_15.148240_4_plen_131_part_00
MLEAELYEDDFTAVNAIKLLERAPLDKPWFLHVSFPGPHDPFLVTTDMRNTASDGRVWPSAQDNPHNGRMNQTRLRKFKRFDFCASSLVLAHVQGHRVGPVHQSLIQLEQEHVAIMLRKSKIWIGCLRWF